MRFIDTIRFSPVPFGGDLPHQYDLFHHNPDNIPTSRDLLTEYINDNHITPDINWWKKQIDRCKNGITIENAVEPGGDAIVDGVDAIWKKNDVYLPDYGMVLKDRAVHISGRYYFFLNFWPIYGLEKGGTVKKVVTPRFLDHQYLVDLRIKMMFRDQKDDQELKGRQLGFSEIVAGMILGWNYTFLPASTNLIVAGTQEDADHTMENCLRGVDGLINTQFYLRRRRGGDSQKKIISKTGSQIRSYTAKDKPQALSRFAPTVVVYEEVGKGKKEWSLKVEEFVKPSLYTEGRKTGYQFFIGTGGEMEEGVYDLETRYYDPKTSGILAFPRRHSKDISGENLVGAITPKWFFQIIDDEGNSLRAKSIEHLKKGAEGLTGGKLYTYWSQHCIYDDDVFKTNTGGYFGKDIILELNKRKIEIRNNRDLQITKRGRLVPLNYERPWDGVKFIHDEEDWWIEILEEPEVDKNGKPFVNLYKAGTDSYDLDEAETSASEGALIVRKMYRQGQVSPFYNCSVAMIKERPTTAQGGAELFYFHTALTCIYYGCQNNIEYGPNNARIFQYYKDNKFEYLLKLRPEFAFAGMLKTQAKNRYGTEAALKPQGLAILKNVLTPEYISRMFFIREIVALANFKIKTASGKRYNCDITMAKMESEIHAKDDESRVVFSITEKRLSRKKGVLVYEEDSRGRIVSKII